ncbi:SAM-dependent methyltransferase [Pedobacter sp. SAFR-022]|uniref:SAM-dependent methyltransferase n=1 Tax=Pedobacter sp. SAFR-022 TaxID=3436861 RepID=UPI003F7FA692
MEANKKGSLIIVGTGISVVGQITLESKAHMEQADRLIYLVADPATIHWVRNLNPNNESLQHYYHAEKKRIITYLEMVKRILTCVRAGEKVCAAFYGHPGVFVFPSHEAIKQARSEGFDARMLPGISAEDCLYADLGVDPGADGCQSFEASDFLLFNRRFDPYVSLVLWQISVIGELGYNTERKYNKNGLEVLIDVLLKEYSPDQLVVVYEAAQYPICQPKIIETTLNQLSTANISGISTLYIPPKGLAEINEDMLYKLGLTLNDLILPDVSLVTETESSVEAQS